MEDYFTNTKAPTLTATYDATVSSSTAITLNSATTYIVVSAISKGIFLSWDRTVSSSDFDEFIPADSTKIYVVPTGKTTVNFIEQSASSALICIEK